MPRCQLLHHYIISTEQCWRWMSLNKNHEALFSVFSENFFNIVCFLVRNFKIFKRVTKHIVSCAFSGQMFNIQNDGQNSQHLRLIALIHLSEESRQKNILFTRLSSIRQSWDLPEIMNVFIWFINYFSVKTSLKWLYF